MNLKLCSILGLLLFCTSCSCYGKVSFAEITWDVDPSDPWFLREGVFMDLQSGFRDKLVEVYVDGDLVLSERVSRFTCIEFATAAEVDDRAETFSELFCVEFAKAAEADDQVDPMNIEIHLPEQHKKYRFRFDPERGPCIGASLREEQLVVEQYNICPTYED